MERNVRALRRQADFSIASRGTIAFVNGCFWYGHHHYARARLPETNAAFWMRKIETNVRRDRRAARELRQQGWRVITIWQCRLRKPERVRARLVKGLYVSAPREV